MRSHNGLVKLNKNAFKNKYEQIKILDTRQFGLIFNFGHNLPLVVLELHDEEHKYLITHL